jgi:putative tryptophan/tyrosine transport system substrate-binding protein
MSSTKINRRHFIGSLGIIVSFPHVAARAQQSNGTWRIGLLMNLAADDPEGQERVTTFQRGLQELGWKLGRNLQIDYRWAAADPKNFRRFAAELVALAPDVLLACTGLAVRPLQQATQTIPIVFTNTNDPVNFGFVKTLSRPGGNVTGFINIEYSFSTKWLELLKQMAPRTRRAAVLWDSNVDSGKAQLVALRAGASLLHVELFPIDMHNADELARKIAAFAQEGDGGLIVTASTLASLHRTLIITLASQHRLPAVYPNRLYVLRGGLISYGPSLIDQYRLAAGYVDRILKGAKPADLPVQAPTTYNMAVNLKTARALNLDLSAIPLALVNDVIEE